MATETAYRRVRQIRAAASELGDPRSLSGAMAVARSRVEDLQ
jgi:hypothetical protein